MQCKKCQNEIIDTDRFCGFCGEENKINNKRILKDAVCSKREIKTLKKQMIAKEVEKHLTKCLLCGEPLPRWNEDIFSWGKDSHRKQCNYCGKCLTSVEDYWGKCKSCRGKIKEEKETKKEMIRAVKKEKELLILEERIKEQRDQELELQRIKEIEINQYRKLRKEIEARPQYQQ